VGVLSVDIVRSGCSPLRALSRLFRRHSPMTKPITKTATGVTTPIVTLTAVESPPELAEELVSDGGLDVVVGMLPDPS
jgi:hypothetical protein